MQIPPRLPPGSSSFPNPKEGKVEGGGVGKGEARNRPVKISEGQVGSRTGDIRVLRELILRRFLASPTLVAGRKDITSIERFVSEGHPLQYLSRIAIAKRFLEKKLSLSLETLRPFYKVVEGFSETEEPAGRESSASTPHTHATTQTFVPPPLPTLQAQDLLEGFNRGKNKNGKWILLPFTCSLGDKTLHACLRLYVEKGAQTASKLALSVRSPFSGEVPWYFVWYPGEPKGVLRMYPPFRKGRESAIPLDLLVIFREKLRKVGFLLDDNKNSRTAFDGFDEIEEKLQNIDVWI